MELAQASTLISFFWLPPFHIRASIVDKLFLLDRRALSVSCHGVALVALVCHFCRDSCQKPRDTSRYGTYGSSSPKTNVHGLGHSSSPTSEAQAARASWGMLDGCKMFGRNASHKCSRRQPSLLSLCLCSCLEATRRRSECIVFQSCQLCRLLSQAK